ncbi:indole-3-glycerol-phosphate synthase [Campylobacter pinnipediorum subsp. caledonicus]|uniref:indole-3-glycerol phosphate synthase TrpC n=1 Tax=Campylobacter pinnipediorum TaxID=1965231 RepID=UPI0009951A6B|nr:indole-3-glycerol phosphate synthase TrpC [Campylobacter pinnipediorum]AQW86356.1 indole-3-glycerol-phosphate synthase [Campylobacter pinnipediorum subsp. caledonicus]
MTLDEIIDNTKQNLKIKKQKIPAKWLEETYKSSYKPRDIISSLKSTKDNPYRIIAEVKKASPENGIIREDFEPLKIAREYQDSGANAISVLAEPKWFKGDLEYITQIRRYIKTPILRKDFIVDQYQILEALIFGADFVLLIAKALTKEELKILFDYSRSLGLEVLLEIHDEDDLQKAIYVNANIIGINHRNLKTFEMDMGLCEKLIPSMPKDKIIVAESGICEKSQLQYLNELGVDAFLIGEYFMRQNNINLAFSKLRGY